MLELLSRIHARETQVATCPRASHTRLGGTASDTFRQPRRRPCHSNALDRPNSCQNSRCTVTPVVRRFPKNVVDREGLIEVCQRDGNAGRGEGGAKKKTARLNRGGAPASR